VGSKFKISLIWVHSATLKLDEKLILQLVLFRAKHNLFSKNTITPVTTTNLNWVAVWQTWLIC
jgi:hypothetical protein